VPCGAGNCRSFSSARDAFRAVLDQAPRVLAVGETHAPKGAQVPSATARFREQLLPLLRGRAQHIVIELWLSAGQCGASEQRVRQQQRVVTRAQAPGNQSEFIALGAAARALGILPRGLTPTCAEYAAISDAGEADIARMLEMVKSRTQAQVEALLERDAADAPLILAYGGALHNDLKPRAGREAWSFGPALAARTRGGYVELDLIVREFVGDTEAWRAQPWYDFYERDRSPDEALLYNPYPGSFALIFPRGP
jgi:hypothetical protein